MSFDPQRLVGVQCATETSKQFLPGDYYVWHTAIEGAVFEGKRILFCSDCKTVFSEVSV